jgi:hypothetical protein
MAFAVLQRILPLFALLASSLLLFVHPATAKSSNVSPEDTSEAFSVQASINKGKKIKTFELVCFGDIAGFVKTKKNGTLRFTPVSDSQKVAKRKVGKLRRSGAPKKKIGKAKDRAGFLKSVKTQTADSCNDGVATPPPPGGGGGGGGSQGEGIVLQVQRLVDPTLGGDAVAYMTPQGWTASAEFYWSIALCPLVTGRAIFESPDGSVGLEVLPQAGWLFSDSLASQNAIHQTALLGQGCPLGNTFSAQQFLQNAILPTVRPGITPQTFNPLPNWENDAVTLLQKDATFIAAAQAGLNPFASASGSEALLVYDRNGVSVEERVGVVLAIQTNDSFFFGPSIKDYNVKVLFAYIYRTPVGQFDTHFPTLASIIQSGRINPAYEQALVEIQKSIFQSNQAFSTELSRIYTELNEDLSEIQRETYHLTSKTIDEAHESFVDLIREVTPARDPETGGEVKVPSIASVAWISDDKSKVLFSKNPAFDPNKDPNFIGDSFTEMQLNPLN